MSVYNIFSQARHIFVALCTTLLLAACTHGGVARVGDSYTFTDDYGQAVNVPSHPSRVVSLSPAVTEIMFALGADSLLVGRTEFCHYPPEAAAIENIGGISNINIEKILSCNPDIIISGSMVPKKVVEKFASMGVPLVCVIEKQQFDGLYGNVEKIGQLTDHAEKADSLVALLRERTLRLPDRRQQCGDTPRPSVYYVVGFGSGGNFTAGGNTFIDDIITMAGGNNIAHDSEGWTYSVEALMQSDPDYILIRAEDSALFCKTAPYNRLSAVRNGHIIALKDGILDLQVPRNIDAIERLSQFFTSAPSASSASNTPSASTVPNVPNVPTTPAQ